MRAAAGIRNGAGQAPAAARAAIAATRTLASTGNSGKKSAKKKKGGNFKEPELGFMLDTVEEIQPIGPDEWDQVEVVHNEAFPEKERDSASIRRKFNGLARVKVPTGDPKCPPAVKRAKRIMRLIEERSDAGQDVDDEHLGLEDDLPEGEVQVGDTPDEEDSNENSAARLAASAASRFREGATAPATAAPTGFRPLTTARGATAVGRGGNAGTASVDSLVQLAVLDLLQKRPDPAREQQQQMSTMCNVMMMSFMEKFMKKESKKRKRKKASSSSDDSSSDDGN